MGDLVSCHYLHVGEPFLLMFHCINCPYCTLKLKLSKINNQSINQTIQDAPDPQYTETKSSILRRRNSKAKVSIMLQFKKNSKCKEVSQTEQKITIAYFVFICLLFFDDTIIYDIFQLSGQSSFGDGSLTGKFPGAKPNNTGSFQS